MASRPAPEEGPCKHGHPAEARFRNSEGDLLCRICSRQANQRSAATKRTPSSPKTPFNSLLSKTKSVNVGTKWRSPNQVSSVLSEEELLDRRATYALGLRLTGTCKACGQDAKLHGNLSYSAFGCSDFEPMDGVEKFKQVSAKDESKYTFSSRRREEEPE